MSTVGPAHTHIHTHRERDIHIYTDIQRVTEPEKEII